MTGDAADLLTLHDAAVPPTAPLSEAARAIYAGVGAVAVVEGERVGGMFGEDDLIRAVFPPYLDEISHTAFVEEDAALGPHFDRLATAQVQEFMRRPETVELATSALDVAQRFLHTDATALVATRGGQYVGVIDQRAFCKSLLRRYGWDF